MRNASGHQCKVKMSGSEKKKVNENTYDISSQKRVTKGLFTWRWGYPVRRGNPPVHVISHFNLAMFT